MAIPIFTLSHGSKCYLQEKTRQLTVSSPSSPNPILAQLVVYIVITVLLILELNPVSHFYIVYNSFKVSTVENNANI